jgi:hypothetical protein
LRIEGIQSSDRIIELPDVSALVQRIVLDVVVNAIEKVLI